MLVASIVMMSLCDGAIALAPSLLWVLVLRVPFGFAMGAEWTAGATMAMENWPARSRGIASGVLQGSWAIGFFLAAVVSRWVFLVGMLWLAESGRVLTLSRSMAVVVVAVQAATAVVLLLGPLPAAARARGVDAVRLAGDTA